MISYRPSNYYLALVLAGFVSTFVIGFFILWGGAWCCFEQFMYEMSCQVAPPQERIIGACLSILVYSIVGCVLMVFSLVLFSDIFMSSDWYNDDVVTPVSKQLYEISLLSDNNPGIRNRIDDIDMIMGSAGTEQPREVTP